MYKNSYLNLQFDKWLEKFAYMLTEIKLKIRLYQDNILNLQTITATN